MRICVAHVISFLLIIVPLVLNSYYLTRNYKEFKVLSEDFATLLKCPNKQKLDSMVSKSLSSHSKQINQMKHQLTDCKEILNPSCCRRGSYVGDIDDCECESKLLNYADERLGATVRNVKAEPMNSKPLQNFMGLGHSTNPPINLLRSNMEPGSCFAFKSCDAEVEVKLSCVVLIDYIEVEHIPKHRSPSKNISSAPRNFGIYGVDPATNREVHLGDFEFTNKNPVQRFKLNSKSKYQILRFKFLTNHGHPKYTCVYRIAVYGFV